MEKGYLGKSLRYVPKVLNTGVTGLVLGIPGIVGGNFGEGSGKL